LHEIPGKENLKNMTSTAMSQVKSALMVIWLKFAVQEPYVIFWSPFDNLSLYSVLLTSLGQKSPFSASSDIPHLKREHMEVPGL
jgi:hypothetical protein